MGYEKVSVSHLQYADDTLILWMGVLNLSYPKIISKCLEKVSGLKVNWSKTHILGISLPPTDCLLLANSLGCSLKDWPSEYLRLPLGIRRDLEIFGIRLLTDARAG